MWCSAVILVHQGVRSSRHIVLQLQLQYLHPEVDSRLKGTAAELEEIHAGCSPGGKSNTVTTITTLITVIIIAISTVITIIIIVTFTIITVIIAIVPLRRMRCGRGGRNEGLLNGNRAGFRLIIIKNVANTDLQQVLTSVLVERWKRFMLCRFGFR